MSNDQMIRDALALPLPEQVELAQILWENVHERVGLPEASEEEIIAEADHRDAELKSGAVDGRSHAEVMAAARRTLGGG